MSLSAQLTALIVPDGTEFPGTVQGLLDLIAQYEEIAGLNPFSGINFGSTTPTADNRDRPWFKTTDAGAPIGWYIWDGSNWVAIPFVTPSGTSAGRPTNASVGQQYFDTDIAVLLVFDGLSWVTSAGTSGDIKYVIAANIEQALGRNPGWAQLPESQYGGRVIGVAGDGPGLTPRAYGDVIGAESVTQDVTQMAQHQHSVFGVAATPRYTATGVLVDAAGVLAPWAASALVDSNPPSATLPMGIIQPTIFVWGIYKV